MLILQSLYVLSVLSQDAIAEKPHVDPRHELQARWGSDVCFNLPDLDGDVDG